MSDRLQYEIEISGSTATLYLAGALGVADLPFLRVLCAAIPTFVTMLRVDLLAVCSPSPDATSAVREILHLWRAQRRGEFQLSLRTSHLTATYRVDDEDAGLRELGGARFNRDALMATYL